MLINKLKKKVYETVRELEEEYTNKRNSWLLTNLKHCGNGIKFNGKVRIAFSQNVEIYNNVHINENAFLNGLGGIIIGENTHIARNFLAYSSNHNYSGACLPYDDTHIHKLINVGRNVWIGADVVLVPGCKIGDGAIIGAGSVVSGEVPPLAIVGSSAPRIIKYRDKKHYEELDLKGRYGSVGGKLLQ